MKTKKLNLNSNTSHPFESGGGDDPKKPFDFSKHFKTHYQDSSNRPVSGEKELNPQLKELFEKFQEESKQNGAEWERNWTELAKRSHRLGIYIGQNTEALSSLADLVKVHVEKQEETNQEVQKTLDEIQRNQRPASGLYYLLVGSLIGGGALGLGVWLGLRHDVPTTMSEEEAVYAGIELLRILGYSIQLSVITSKGK